MNAHILEAKVIAPEQIVPEAQAKFDAGYRLVTVTVLAADEQHVELLYHYDKANHMEHLRAKIQKDIPIPSISGIYFCALLIENEVQDLFDVRFGGLVLDFKRTLLLSDETKKVVNAPFFYIPAQKNTVKRA
ncbi:MAG: NADH-quinone oxidoreductase subunit C [Deltaproteobacteria bacterium]|jgi:ech hydrogenase subunit D|nr:NADH-quinone oxidoreductase subunit C [Deltaproteobacteria bacterium]